MDRTIFHIDVNSAFLSWSALKQLQENPGSIDLRTLHLGLFSHIPEPEDFIRDGVVIVLFTEHLIDSLNNHFLQVFFIDRPGMTDVAGGLQPAAASPDDGFAATVVPVNELLCGEQLDENYKEQADENIMDVFAVNKSINKRKLLCDILTGAGAGIILGVVYAPDTTKKAICVEVGLALLWVG